MVVLFSPILQRCNYHQTVPWRNNPMYLSTDACSTGAGGFFNGQYFHTPFPSSVLHRFGHDINTLELLAIMVALKIWAPLLQGQRLVLQSNNENSVLALNSGRSRAPGMQRCLHKIWFLTPAWDFEIVSTHIPGVKNSIADHLSRWHLSPMHRQRFPRSGPLLPHLTSIAHLSSSSFKSAANFPLLCFLYRTALHQCQCLLFPRLHMPSMILWP